LLQSLRINAKQLGEDGELRFYGLGAENMVLVNEFAENLRDGKEEYPLDNKSLQLLDEIKQWKIQLEAEKAKVDLLRELVTGDGDGLGKNSGALLQKLGIGLDREASPRKGGAGIVPTELVDLQKKLGQLLTDNTKLREELQGIHTGLPQLLQQQVEEMQNRIELVMGAGRDGMPGMDVNESVTTLHPPGSARLGLGGIGGRHSTSRNRLHFGRESAATPSSPAPGTNADAKVADMMHFLKQQMAEFGGAAPPPSSQQQHDTPSKAKRSVLNFEQLKRFTAEYSRVVEANTIYNAQLDTVRKQVHDLQHSHVHLGGGMGGGPAMTPNIARGSSFRLGTVDMNMRGTLNTPSTPGGRVMQQVLEYPYWQILNYTALFLLIKYFVLEHSY
jgi:hypothetical protein